MKRISFYGSVPALLCLLASAPAALAQKWEVGGAAGGSFYTTQTVTNVAGTADAGLKNGFAASFLLGNNISNLIGGDLRYDYEKSDLSLKSSGGSASFSGDTHAVHYDVLVHFAPKSSRIRPFVSGGGGVKDYRGTGKETASQPLSNLAFLTKTSEIKPLISVGGGIKFAIARAFQVRLEVRDALTPFPKNVIAPAQGSKIGGWLQDFVVMAALSITF